MKTVLFIILPVPSHLNASFGLAKEFQDRGYKIVFTGFSSFKNYIEQQGYEFYHMGYATENWIQTIKEFAVFFFLSLLDKENVIKRYRMWYKSVVEVKKVCEFYDPEIIFIDAHLSHYYLYLLDYRESITILSTKMPTKKSPDLPPLNSFYVPKKTFVSRLVCELLWSKYNIKSSLKRLKTKLAFLNKDVIYFQKRFCKKHHLYWDDIFEKQNTFFIGLKNAPTLILGMEKLEFSMRKRFSNECYVNLFIQRNEEKLFSDEYVLARKKIEKLKNQSGRHIIYCSFGTLSGPDYKRVSKFVNKLICVVQKQRKIVLVISTGELNLSIDKHVPNVFFLKQVPQLDMLSLCEMMITHGGHNSIKECLQARVPMLVYPLNEEIDQPGNAIRVYKAGFGLYGKINKDTPDIIAGKINRVLEMKI